ncbi:MAG: tRNA uridine-5-carboxymethylaminomethyl(34) synthesis GTPase MnmE, partial [Candidatus Margulisbacteria bacterium]|nr:tRNA uridine-5-carboxymethylaminomethyl(34) synthesis GTPase MnmE [Candidatus Margulisiibacteriota bacterium]
SIFSRVIKTTTNQIVDHQMRHGWLINPLNNAKTDDVLACFMKGPRTFCGEDTAEIYCHGGPAVLSMALQIVIEQGARLAERGEFSKRAFLNGKIDLAQAEAILDLIKAPVKESAGTAIEQLRGGLSRTINEIKGEMVKISAKIEAGIDFPGEQEGEEGAGQEIEKLIIKVEALIKTADYGRIYREGLAVAIVGKPNVGKSSLLNSLVGSERAIVSSLPGTTRDTIEEQICLHGMPIRVVDTAGIRHPKDEAEGFGVERAKRELDAAEFAIVVLDGSNGIGEEDKRILELSAKGRGIVLINKTDLGIKITCDIIKPFAENKPIFFASLLKGEGVEELKKGIYDETLKQIGRPAEGALAINARHKECLARAQESLHEAKQELEGEGPREEISRHLKAAVMAAGEISGEEVSDEIINAIFDKFCIGK